ncbi:SDR family oxidoreductase [Balneola sp. MJW-20]|uniref:SDR family oxidoreductase n=1 Tax=Gracilimonas aurantiaca TaxID=3234185 RepID=UPI0034660886
MNDFFKDKVCIVTGSSRGIGKTIAKDLASKGSCIVLNGRNRDSLDSTFQEVENITGKGRVIKVCSDVGQGNGAEELINKTLDHFKGIDILINNAGVSMRGALAEIKPLAVEKVIHSNVHGAILPTIYSLPHLRKSQGSIVFISSLAAIRGLPYLSIYSASKMALRGIAEAIRIEEHEHDIHVGMIYVGFTENEESKRVIGSDGKPMPLNKRDSKKALSRETVSKAVLKNIQNRRFITTMTAEGKINGFINSIIPGFVEWMVLKSIDKFRDRLK